MREINRRGGERGEEQEGAGSEGGTGGVGMSSITRGWREKEQQKGSSRVRWG